MYDRLPREANQEYGERTVPSQTQGSHSSPGLASVEEEGIETNTNLNYSQADNEMR